MAQALRPPVADPEQAKFNQRLLDKIKYCKEVLVSIRNASSSAPASSTSTPSETDLNGFAAGIPRSTSAPDSGAADGMRRVVGRASKASLR